VGSLVCDCLRCLAFSSMVLFHLRAGRERGGTRVDLFPLLVMSLCSTGGQRNVREGVVRVQW